MSHPNKEEVFRFEEEKPAPALRSDLKISPVMMRRRLMFFVKDPVSLKYYRWGEREHRLATLLDGERKCHELVDAMRNAFPGSNVNREDVERTINQFLSTGLLKTDGRVARLLHSKTREHALQATRRKRWLSVPGKIIMFKVTLFDPDLLLLRLNRWLGFVWSRPAIITLLALLATASFLLTSDAANLSSRMPDLFGWQNILIMWLVLLAVKVVHEFGHGLACKHFGGEVHEMGAMFIVFSPFLFCNASDSWMFPEKRKRLIVVLGGIYFELFLAAAGAIAWVLTPPGLLNQIAFNVMLVCSVVTIFFNANPLMKFDGYYALSDFLEMPNLKERGDKTLIGSASSLLSGASGSRDPLAESMKGTLMTYAVASYAWMLFMTYNVLKIIGVMLEPAGLDRLAQSAAAITLFAGLLAPPFMVGMSVVKTIKEDASGKSRRRCLRVSGIAVALFCALMFMPVPVSVRSACVIDASNRVRVTASTTGFLETIGVRDGERVEAGAFIASLTNPGLLQDLENTRLRLQSAKIEESDVLHRDASNSGGARATRRQLEAILAKAEKDAGGLEITAPVAGMVLARGMSEKKGTLIRRGDLLCEIVPAGPLHAIVALTESEAGLVSKGQEATFRLHSLPQREFHGRVLAVDSSPVLDLPHQSLGEMAGGTIPSVLAPGLPQENALALPAQVIYKARLEISDPGESLRPGMSGRISIACGRSPLAKELWRRATTLLRTDFQL